MKQLDDERIISKNPEVNATMLDGELIIMGPKDNIYYRVNKSGIHIWGLINRDECTVSDVVTYIANYYEVKQEHISKDVETFISLMIEKDIFQINYS